METFLRLIILLALMPIDVPQHQTTITDYPAVMVVYDPALGGINCDHDCGTIATGRFEEWMYGEVGACDQSLLGAYITFHPIDLTIYCGDTGGAIKPTWSQRDNRMVLYFDVLWPLETDGNKIVGEPYWNYWLIEDWSVSWSK